MIMNKFLLTISAFALTFSAGAQQNKVTAQDYERAEKTMSYNTEPLVDRSSVRPNWFSGDKFWYVVNVNGGREFVTVDPSKKTRTLAFDHAKLAAALSAATNEKYTAQSLPFQAISMSDNDQAFLFSVKGKRWKYTPKSNQIAAAGEGTDDDSQARRPMRGGNEILSPDGKLAAFIKEYNLWVRDVASGKQTQLTTNGVKDYGYATDNAGWAMSDRPVLLWSPDSRKIATYQQDQRKVGDMYLVSTNVGKPTLKAWKYPLPGDKDVTMIERVIIDVASASTTRLQIPADQRRSTLSDDIKNGGSLADTYWNNDASQLAFVSSSRDHKSAKVRIADANTGAVKEIFEEVSPTQFESGWSEINWRYLPSTNEILWFSERDNWGHLYLYDANTGKLKNQVTKGDWVVTRVLKVDEKNRVLYFTAGGKESGNPYFSHLYKIGFDGKNLISLTPEEGNHQVSFSPSGNYFVDTYSQPNVPPVTVVRSSDGKTTLPLEKADVSRLAATGWHSAIPVSVKAGDGKTDIYGLVFTPFNMDPNKKYPVIDYIYPGPQGGSVGSWSFAASKGDNQALAELGFIVVVMEGTSNPLRSKSFHDMSYGNMAENTLPDQIAAIRQLSKIYPMDTTRVGIWGHSGGGFATAAAMFRYPDFFKVGIAESGNHDNRNYEDNWGERYNGLAENVNYEAQANQNYAKNLKGKLMLAHGMMDNNVPPSNTLLVVDALIKANKTFDLILFPNSAHGFGPFSSYMMRRRWDYFVTHLLQAEPPKDYQIKGPQRN